MSYLSLLATSVTQGLSNLSTASPEIEREAFASPNPAVGTGNGTWGGLDEYLLPLGIASLEHWQDLNA